MLMQGINAELRKVQKVVFAEGEDESMLKAAIGEKQLALQL